MNPACGCMIMAGGLCSHQLTELDKEMGLPPPPPHWSAQGMRKAELHWSIRGSDEAFRDWPHGAVLRSKPFCHPDTPEVTGVVELVRGEKEDYGEKYMSARIVVQGLAPQHKYPEAKLDLGGCVGLVVRNFVQPHSTFHFENHFQRWDRLNHSSDTIVKASFSFYQKPKLG